MRLLALWAPQNFHVTQQRAWGGRHVTALRSRFIDDAVMATLEAVVPSPDAEDAGDSPSTVADAAPATPAAAAEPSEPGGLLAELARQRRAGWAQ